MAKKDKKEKAAAKKARIAEKSQKAKVKAEGKNKKKAKKQGLDEEDQDIDEILKTFQQEQEAFEEVNIEKCLKPTKRINPAMVASPIHGKRELYLFGGESINDNGLTVFYNDLYTYSVDSDIWRRIVSKNSPLPRSSHAMCAHPSGIILLFGGEFSSPKQNTFYHYGDTWILDSEDKKWAKVEGKKGPSARSGSRMCVWKGTILLFGGFRDLGSSTTYMNDLWVFDISSHKWQQVEFPLHHPIPDARSGHSLVPYASGVDSGAVLWGGYTKVKAGKGLQKGKHLTDTWVLKMKTDLKQVRWERRKKQGFNPSPRAGCSLVPHGGKGRYIMYGGVYDTEETEESLDSIFYNNLFCYQAENNKWFNLSIRPQKKKNKEKTKANIRDTREQELEEFLNSILVKNKLNDEDSDGSEDEGTRKHLEQLKLQDARDQQEDEEADDDAKEYPVRYQLPHPRFNATTCVVDDTYFIYGGIWEHGEREINIDSFYGIDLAKLDGVKIFWEDMSEVEKALAESSDEEGSDDEGFDDEDDDDDDDEVKDKVLVAEDQNDEDEEEAEEEDEMEVPDERPWLPHPKPFESLRNFYLRTGAQFLEWSISSNRDARGKYLKKAAFELCEGRWWERREQVRIAEDRMEEMGNVGEVIEKDASQKQSKRR